MKPVCRSTGIGGMVFPVRTNCVRATHGDPADDRGGHGLRATWRESEGEEARGQESEKREAGTQGALATRNPTLTLVRPGVLKMRWEERRLSASWAHEPPRSTRNDPLAGPVGFVTGLDA